MSLIALDVDGVLADLQGYICQQLSFDRSQWTTWRSVECFGPDTGPAVQRLMHDPATWVSLEPLPGAQEAVRQLAAHHYLHLLTAIPPNFLPLRRWWLARHFPFVDFLHPLLACSLEEKPTIAQSLGAHWLVDDNPDVCAASAALGIKTVLVPSTYAGTPAPGVRLMTLTDFAEMVTR